MHPLAAAVLTLVGVVLAYAIGVPFVEWRAQRAFEHIRQASQQTERNAQIRTEQIQREAADRQERRAADARAGEADRMRLIAEREAAADSVRRAVVEEATRKERAWAKFYKKPSHCDQAATVECANVSFAQSEQSKRNLLEVSCSVHRLARLVHRQAAARYRVAGARGLPKAAECLIGRSTSNPSA
jgi:hypothetical protein